MGQLRGLAAGEEQQRARWAKERGGIRWWRFDDASIQRIIVGAWHGLWRAGLMCTLFTRCSTPHGTWKHGHTERLMARLASAAAQLSCQQGTSQPWERSLVALPEVV